MPDWLRRPHCSRHWLLRAAPSLHRLVLVVVVLAALGFTLGLCLAVLEAGSEAAQRFLAHAVTVTVAALALFLASSLLAVGVLDEGHECPGPRASIYQGVGLVVAAALVIAALLSR
jgi:hypothetical protein